MTGSSRVSLTPLEPHEIAVLIGQNGKILAISYAAACGLPTKRLHSHCKQTFTERCLTQRAGKVEGPATVSWPGTRLFLFGPFSAESYNSVKTSL